MFVDRFRIQQRIRIEIARKRTEIVRSHPLHFVFLGFLGQGVDDVGLGRIHPPAVDALREQTLAHILPIQVVGRRIVGVVIFESGPAGRRVQPAVFVPCPCKSPSPAPARPRWKSSGENSPGAEYPSSPSGSDTWFRRRTCCSSWYCRPSSSSPGRCRRWGSGVGDIPARCSAVRRAWRSVPCSASSRRPICRTSGPARSGRGSRR